MSKQGLIWNKSFTFYMRNLGNNLHLKDLNHVFIPIKH